MHQFGANTQEENPELDLRIKLKAKCDYIEELENTVESYELALKENKNEFEILDTKLKNKSDIILEYENNFVNVEDLRSLQQEVEEKATANLELREKLHKTEKELEMQSSMQELVEVAEAKTNRISELEDALRESLKITTERELVLQQEEVKRKQILEKVLLIHMRIFVFMLILMYRFQNWNKGYYLCKLPKRCGAIRVDRLPSG